VNENKQTQAGKHGWWPHERSSLAQQQASIWLSINMTYASKQMRIRRREIISYILPITSTCKCRTKTTKTEFLDLGYNLLLNILWEKYKA